MGVALTGGAASLAGASCGGSVVSIGLEDGGDAGQDEPYNHIGIDVMHADEGYAHIGIRVPEAGDAPYNHIAPDLGTDAPYDLIDSGPYEDAYAHIGIAFEAGEADGYDHIKSP